MQRVHAIPRSLLYLVMASCVLRLRCAVLVVRHSVIPGCAIWSCRNIRLKMPRNRKNQICQIRPVTMETRCFQKKSEFHRYPPKDFRNARYERKSSRKKISNFSKTPKKKNPGPILGQDRPEKNSAKCLLEAARFQVLGRHRWTKPTTPPWNLNSGQTSMDKTNDCAVKSERGALVRGSDLPSGHSVDKTTGDRWRAPARRLIQTYLGAAL